MNIHRLIDERAVFLLLVCLPFSFSQNFIFIAGIMAFRVSGCAQHNTGVLFAELLFILMSDNSNGARLLWFFP